MSSARSIIYRVDLSARAERDLAEIHETINAIESLAAAHWFNALETLVFSLDHFPERGRQTPENRSLRQLLHGDKPHIYRVIYRVEELSRSVVVLHIRHGARTAFEETDLETGG